MMRFNNFFTSEGRHYEKAIKISKKVLDLEEEYSKLSNEELKNKTVIFKERLKKESLDEILVEAYATCREASKRVINEFPFKVQVLGGVLLHYGDIAEMKTGEGKTLTATMPIYLNALAGKGAHVITVNEYLAQRDAEWMGQIYNFLGLSVGVNRHGLTKEQKQAVFNCDITYTTNSEVGFDYLRDNMAIRNEDKVLRGLNFAIIDEVDSILIDEARTPLIISGPGESLDSQYLIADRFIKSLHKNDVEVFMEDNAVNLSESGIKRAERYFKIDNIFDQGHADLIHFIQNALRANILMNKDVEYIVSDDEIVLIDKFTGRKMEGREFSDGLHQAIQAKENVGIKLETMTLATITYQNFFRLYNKLSGMTGTAKSEEDEFINIYNMRVYCIPTNKDIIRIDDEDKIFLTKKEKYEAIVDKVVELYNKKQPVLIGTISIDMSLALSDMLKRKNIPHQILNAIEDKYEASIVSNAGKIGTITIATNMAGRGTDIKLDEEVKELGGLVVLGSERHESRRIDNQLRGRSGRQGDPGYTCFYSSFEDDLVIRYSSENTKEIIESFNEKTSNDKMIKIMDMIQKRAEGLNYDSRKQVLEFDDVLMEQRLMVFKTRDEILNQENIDDTIIPMLSRFFKSMFNENNYLELGFSEKTDFLKNVLSKYDQIKQDESIEEKAKSLLLIIMDRQWIEHIDNMSRFQKGVYLRQYAQIKPLDAFKEEAYIRFENMMNNIVEQFSINFTRFINEI
ncbi:MAG: preprotein translocase subunit SecA [Erysipelotrichaceae bacterium]|nr:preprotein translocase subunit SecA [Erysipelotrichaceae bacterium]